MWRFAAVLLGMCLSLCAWAQGSFPTKPIRFVVPFPPGGIDTPARALTQKMSEDLGQPIVVENRAGANGAIGFEAGAKAGTFVEIKNSRIGERTKVPHLSYLGDADVGADTNIAAGNITKRWIAKLR